MPNLFSDIGERRKNTGSEKGKLVNISLGQRGLVVYIVDADANASSGSAI